MDDYEDQRDQDAINEGTDGQSKDQGLYFGMDISDIKEAEAAEVASAHSGEKRVRRRRSMLQQILRDGMMKVPKIETIDEESSVVPAPSTKIQQLLNETSKSLERGFPCQMFTEMKVLSGTGVNQEWREIARWVKYEETVEEGGNRWSKPHVATLTLHSLFELRSCFLKGVLLFDLQATTVEQIVDAVMEAWIMRYSLKRSVSSGIRDALMSKHRHQYENSRLLKDGMSTGQSFLQTVRSFADIGRSFSHARIIGSTDSSAAQSSNLLTVPDTQQSQLGTSSSGTQISLPVKVGQKGADHGTEQTTKGNYHLYKKLSRDAQAANVLIGQLQSLDCRLSVFVRLHEAYKFDNLTEVPIPTRFVFILLGPPGSLAKYTEVGRALSTLMSDEVFSEVASKAKSRQDFLDGIDEFLEQVVVLPPDEWDPAIRIEPPASVPSQEGRKKPPVKAEDGEAIKDALEKGHEEDVLLKRTGKWFGGLIQDVKRKIKWYPSDFKDAINLQCLAAFLYMYFAMLAPIVTFGGLLEEATDRNLAAMENLLSGAICGIMYSLFSGQPLTMIGSTGPVLIFEKLVFDFCDSRGMDFLGVRFWINIWSAIVLLVIVGTDLSSLVSYITRFTEESFAVLISFIFIYESMAKLLGILNQRRVIMWNPRIPAENYTCSCVPQNGTNFAYLRTVSDYRRIDMSSWLLRDQKTNETLVDWNNIPLDYCTMANGRLEGNACYRMLDVFLASVVLLFGTFTFAMVFKRFRNSSYFPSRVRAIISDFAVILSIVIMIMVDIAMGLDTPKLYVPEEFKPTREGRPWVVSPLGPQVPWWIPVITPIPAALLCILLFMDHQITVVIVNRRENKLKKGCGYHLDLFMIFLVCLITGIFGLPIFVAATVMSVSHVNALRQLSECQAPGEKPKFVGVREQRLTGVLVFLFIGLSVLMTSVLKHIPMPVLYGVFLYMGVSSLVGVQMIDRLLLFLMPMKYQPDSIYLRHVPIRRVHLFTFCQITCFIVLCTIKEIKETSMGFPILLVFLVAIRKLLEFVFTDNELIHLDDKMPELFLRHKEDAKKKKQTEEEEQAQANAISVRDNEDVEIPIAYGHVMTFPLKTLSRTASEEKELNLSEEVTRTGLWKHIASSVDVTTMKNGKKVKVPDDKGNLTGIPFAEEEDDTDTEAITISFHRNDDMPKVEAKPLLNADSDDYQGTKKVNPA